MHKKKDDSLRRIGFFSYQKGTGVTHLTLTYGAFFSSRMGRRVWIWEIGNQHTLENLGGYLRVRCYGEEGTFQGDKITFFPNLSVERAMGLVKDAPEVLIIDFGQMNKEKECLLSLCHERVLVCDFSPWKQGDILRTLSWKKQEKEVLWNRCVCHLGHSGIGKARRYLGEKIYVIPEIGNPFSIKRQDVKNLVELCQIQH